MDPSSPSYSMPVYLLIVLAMFLLACLIWQWPRLAGIRARLLRYLPVRRETVNRVEKQLLESRHGYELLVSNMAEGIAFHELIVDESGLAVDYRIIEVNQQFESILGMLKEDVVGRLARDLYKTPSAPFLGVYAEVVSSGLAVRFEAFIAALDRYFSISVTPWGRNGFATIFTDVTEQKTMQDTLKSLNRDLEERIAGEILRRLEHERILARQARHAAMGEMIGAIAHQWRQPLATVSVIIQNMAAAWKVDRLSKEYVDQALDVAQQQISYMTNTIEEFLAFFRPDKLKERFNVNDKILESIAFVEPQLKAQGIRITTGSGFSADRFVSGYQNEFRQVILNLIVNARDAIRDGYVQEQLPVENGAISVDLSEAGESVVVTVADNGCGIAPEVGDKVFEPYFTTRELSGGTGIGLYMSRLIVEEGMGGAISFTSRPGETVFRVSLPSCEYH